MCMCVRDVDLFIQHAIFMRRVLTSFVALLAPSNFSTLSHKRRDFRKELVEHKMCVFIFSITLSKIFLTLNRI
jgi:hypothetical protein